MTPEALSVTALDDAGNEMHTETYSVDDEPALLKDTPFYRITGVYVNGEAQIFAGVYGTELRDQKQPQIISRPVNSRSFFVRERRQ